MTNLMRAPLSSLDGDDRRLRRLDLELARHEAKAIRDVVSFQIEVERRQAKVEIEQQAHGEVAEHTLRRLRQVYDAALVAADGSQGLIVAGSRIVARFEERADRAWDRHLS
jgi:hypothetical protein